MAGGRDGHHLPEARARWRCFADASVAEDVLLTYNILGAAKAERLMAPTRRIRPLTVVLDNEAVARGLSEAAAARAGQDAPLPGRVRHRHGPHRRADAATGAFELAGAAMRLPRIAVPAAR